jgi:hypothetical protein
MRKWARDSERHGIQIGLYNRRGPMGQGSQGGGNPGMARITDDRIPRVLDGATNSVTVYDGPRSVDRLVL